MEKLLHKELKNDLLVVLRHINRFWQTEHRLPNGRVADLYLHNNGYTTIIECKTEYRPSSANVAVDKYWCYCNQLWLCYPRDHFPPSLTVCNPLNWAAKGAGVGLMTLRGGFITFHRPAEDH